MSNSLILLEAKKIKSLTETKSYEIEVFEELQSTNDYLLSFCKNNEVRICLAETQTQGRGRMQRHWYSPFGQNIYFSMLYPFSKNIGELGGLSLALGLNVCHVIEERFSFKFPIQVKWPNDILYENKKLAGVLIDLQAKNQDYYHAVIGVGINVNMLPIDGAHSVISQPWTSLREISGQYYDRNLIAAKLIDIFLLVIQQFEKTGLNSFQEEWNRRDALYDKKISVTSGNRQITGKSLGITPQGYLILESEEGKKLHFSSGEASILKF
jgi:BirA family biotin operon repressor/biotin-[acetyl-CoA-carboxylase] ligase